MKNLVIFLIALSVSSNIRAQNSNDPVELGMMQWRLNHLHKEDSEYRAKWQWQPPPQYTIPNSEPSLLPDYSVPQVDLNIDIQPQEDYFGEQQRQREFQQQQWNQSFQNGLELGVRAAEDEYQKQIEERLARSDYEPKSLLDTAEVRLGSGSTYLTTTELAIQMGLPMLRYEVQHSSAPAAQQPIKSDWHNLFTQPKPLSIDPVAYQRAVDSLTIISSAVTASRKDVLTGFLGISWGTSQENVKRVILNRLDGARLGRQNHDSIWFYHGWFGDFAYSRMTLRFVDNKLYSGEVNFEIPYSRDTANDSSLTIFEAIRDGIANKHGKPTFDNPAVFNEVPSASWWWPKRDTSHQADNISVFCFRDTKKPWHIPDGKTPAIVSVCYTCGELEDQYYLEKEAKMKARPQAKDY